MTYQEKQAAGLDTFAKLLKPHASVSRNKGLLGLGILGGSAALGGGVYATHKKRDAISALAQRISDMINGDSTEVEKAASKVETVLREYKQGKLRSGSKQGPKVQNRKQAVAIALSEAREAGEDVPEKKAAPYMHMLSAEERAEMMRVGIILKQASMGKDAQSLSGLADMGTKGILLGSAVTGIPLGIMAHLIHKKVRSVRDKEKELAVKTQYYQNAARNLEQGLASGGASL
jgi:hypothetical protein